jgi:tripartite-type tricarboxylate transporter receptor subunit TctC
MRDHRWLMAHIPCTVVLLLTQWPIAASAQQPFYAGKTITLTVGFGSGGSYDLYSRLLARHLGKHIPGNPDVVVFNRPGAGGMLAFNQAGKVAPKDGTLITTVSQGLLLQEVVNIPGLQVSLGAYNWIGNFTQSNNVTATWFTSPIKTMDDARKREVTVAASGAGSTSSQMATVYNNLLGTKFKAIMGYEGGSQENLAMERGETDGRATNTWSSYRASFADPKAKLNILVQIGLRKEIDLPDVPLLDELVKHDVRKHSVALLISQSLALARMVAAPPEVPKDRVELLRRGFDAAMKDPELVSEAMRSGLDISPMTGSDVQDVVAQVLATPKDLREAVSDALRPPNL